MNVVQIVPKLELYILEVEETLQQTISSNTRIMNTITHYILRASGKRLRPALFLTAAGLDKPVPRLVNTAASIELIHTASLVHDDIVDQSALRRGMPTVNAKWGNEISVLAGDYLFARAFTLLTQSGCREIINILAAVIEGMSVGEIEQLTDAGNTELTEEDYLDRIKKKTACFMAGVCQAGGVVREAGREELADLYDFGLHLGLAFQIKDDILDFQGEEAVTGKPVGSDLRQGIITLPVIHLLRFGDGREDLSRHIRRGELTEARLQGIMREMQRVESLDYCLGLVGTYTERARKALEGVKDGEIRENLSRILQANVSRDY